MKQQTLSSSCWYSLFFSSSNLVLSDSSAKIPLLPLLTYLSSSDEGVLTSSLISSLSSSGTDSPMKLNNLNLMFDINILLSANISKKKKV